MRRRAANTIPALRLGRLARSPGSPWWLVATVALATMLRAAHALALRATPWFDREHLAHRDHRVARGHRGGRQTADREAGAGNVAAREAHHVPRRVQPEHLVTRRQERPRRGTRPAAEIDHEAARDAGAAQQGQQARRRAAREVRVSGVVYVGEVGKISRQSHVGCLGLVWYFSSMRSQARWNNPS